MLSIVLRLLSRSTGTDPLNCSHCSACSGSAQERTLHRKGFEHLEDCGVLGVWSLGFQLQALSGMCETHHETGELDKRLVLTKVRALGFEVQV